MPRRAPAASYLEQPPADPAALAGFPRVVLPAGSEIHRIHSAGRGAWYFNDDDAWRFNLCDVPGRGTCYLAERPVAGLLETFKGITVVDEGDILVKAHFHVELDRDLRLANCCDKKARDFGVNAEIHSTLDYPTTQAWAAALDAAGFDGIRYLCRSDPEMHLVGYALFGPAGAPPPGDWPGGFDVQISDEILAEAEAYGLRVRPTP